MTPEIQHLQALHAQFQELTRQKLTLSYQRQMTWAQFVQRGLTAEDLALVIRWTQAQIARGEGGFSPLSLQFGAMLADLDRFEDRLNVARTSKFARKTSGPARPAPEAEAPAISPEEEERLRAAGRDTMAALKRTLRGGSA